MENVSNISTSNAGFAPVFNVLATNFDEVCRICKLRVMQGHLSLCYRLITKKVRKKNGPKFFLSLLKYRFDERPKLNLIFHHFASMIFTVQ